MNRTVTMSVLSGIFFMVAVFVNGQQLNKKVRVLLCCVKIVHVGASNDHIHLTLVKSLCTYNKCERCWWWWYTTSEYITEKLASHHHSKYFWGLVYSVCMCSHYVGGGMTSAARIKSQ